MSALSSALSIEQATTVVLSHTSALAPESLAPLDALSLTLSHDVLAARPHPPFAASIKDGYAVRAADGEGEYEVLGASRAGGPAPSPLAPRQAAYITTGAPLPPGADAVVMVEKAQEVPGGRIAIAQPPKPGQEVRAIGSDIAQGATVLRAGDRIGAAEVGLLACVGCRAVGVAARPCVAVLSTGDELLDPLAPAAEAASAEAAAAANRIFDSNRPLLLAAASAEGARAIDLGIGRDEAAVLEGKLDAALDAAADVLVCSGGVSMGDRDLVKPLLSRRGTVHFGLVRMKPGKPLTFATVPRRTGDAPKAPLLVFGLPGNPVSAFACFHLVVAPALRAMLGDPNPRPRRVLASLGHAVTPDPERPEYVRAVVVSSERGLEVHSTGGQISSRLLSCRGADALIELPAIKGKVAAGSTVSALLIGGVNRGLGCRDDRIAAPLPPAPPTPTPTAAPPLGSPAAQALVATPCKVGLLLQGGATADGAGGGGAAAAALDALSSLLPPGSLSLQRVEAPSAASADELQASLIRLCDEAHCALVLAIPPDAARGVGGAGERFAMDDAVAAVAPRETPGMASLVRSACLAHAPAEALLCRSAVAMRGQAILMCLPAHPAAAAACVRAVCDWMRGLLPPRKA